MQQFQHEKHVTFVSCTKIADGGNVWFMPLIQQSQQVTLCSFLPRGKIRFLRNNLFTVMEKNIQNKHFNTHKFK